MKPPQAQLPHPRSPQPGLRAIVVQPPLVLSPDFIDYPYFASLAAYQAAATLRAAGVAVTVVDAFALPQADLRLRPPEAWLGAPPKTFAAALAAPPRADFALLVASPFLMAAPGRRTLGPLVRALRQRGDGLCVVADLFVGGMHYLETDPAALLAECPDIDLLLRYEGEPLLERLVAELRAGRRPQERVWANHEPFPLTDLPAPAVDLLAADAYFACLGRALGAAWRPGPIPAAPARTLPLVTARGCPYGCVFCTRNPGLPGERRQHRAVPWPRVRRWIRRFAAELRLERLVVLDEIPNLDPRRFTALLDAAAAEGLSLAFPNGLRADRLTDAHIARLCDLTPGIKVSLESANPRVQREVLGKRLDPAAVERVAAACQRVRLPLEVHCIVGLPGERRAEIEETAAFAVALHERYGARPLVQFAIPLPGTTLDRLVQQGALRVAAPAHLHAAFQQGPVFVTAEFDEAFLRAVVADVRRRTGAPEPPPA